MQNLQSKLLWCLAILAPGILILLGPRLVSSFGVDKVAPPLEVLRDGGAYISCTAPFEPVVETGTGEQTALSCVIVDGREAMRLFPTVPFDPGSTNWNKQGLSLLLEHYFSNRFQGKTITVAITAKCERCTRPVQVLYATGVNGNSGWVPLNLTPEFSKFTFDYDVPPNNDHRKINPRIVLNTNNPDDAKIFISGISVVAEQ